MFLWPEWEYKDVPNWRDVLLPRCLALADELRKQGFDTIGRTSNTRSTHKRLFSGLTPPLYPKFAGNYRGTDLPELRSRPVTILSDRRVGTPPQFVLSEIQGLATQIGRIITLLDQKRDSSPRADFLLILIRYSCEIFQVFLRIHPYVNGNGHVARWMMWAFLARYGFWLRDFPLADRPADPPYSALIKAHRDGDRSGLEDFVLKAIDPSSLTVTAPAQASA